MATEHRTPLTRRSPSVTGSRGSGIAWKPRAIRTCIDPEGLRSEVRKKTPPNDLLRQKAKQAGCQPPQEWYDDSSDPFVRDE